MAGAPLSAYADFFASTGSAVYGSEEDFCNDAQKNSPTLARFIAGKDLEDLFYSGGKNFTGAIMLDESPTAVNHLPGNNFTWSNPQVLDYWTAPQRYTMDHTAMIEQEWMQNSPEKMTGPWRFQELKSIQKKVEMRAMTSIYNFMSNKIWAVPDSSLMESTTATGTEQYSIPAFVNEYPSGLFNRTSVTVGMTPWTSVEGIDPTATGNSRWDIRRATYISDDTGRPATGPADDVISAFGKMFRRIQYRPYTTFEQYTTQSPMDKVFIATSERGMTHFEECCRDRQDRFIQATDPGFPGVNFRGIPVEYHEELDAAPIYPNISSQTTGLANAPTANITEGNSAGTVLVNFAVGPRYYWLSPRFLGPVFHKERYFYKRKPIVPPDQPEALIVPISTWWNFRATSRRRLGLVSPRNSTAADKTPFAPYVNAS